MNPLIQSIRKHTDGSVEEIVKFLIQKGIISYTSITHAEIYMTYSTLLERYTLKNEPKAKMKAAYDTSIEHNIALSTVYEIKKEFKDLI